LNGVVQRPAAAARRKPAAKAAEKRKSKP